MNIQDLFYLIGIIFMVSGIILVIAITTVLILLYKKITEVRDFLMGTVQDFIHKILNPKEMAVSIGTSAARTLVKRVREIF